MSVAAGIVIGAYVVYRLKGGPKLKDRLTNKIRNFIGDYIPMAKPQEDTITLNQSEYKIR